MRRGVTFTHLVLVFLLLSNLSFSLPLSLVDADKYLELHTSKSTLIEAYETYQNIAKKEPNNFELQWRLSATSHFLGLKYSENESEKEDWYKKGLDFGKKSVELKENCAQCQFWYSINQVLYAEVQGIFSLLTSLSKVKRGLSRVIELDEHYAMAGSYRVLGSLYSKLPGIVGGDNDEAEKNFRKAVEKERNYLNYLFLAKFYLEEKGDKKKALEIVTEALARKYPEKLEVENVESKIDLLELQKKITTSK